MKTTATAAAAIAALLPGTLAQSLCGQFDNYANAGYKFNNNEWGKDAGTGSGCLYVDSSDASGVAFNVPWNWAGGDNNVKAYPYAGLDFTDRKFISDIGSMPTAADWGYTGDNIRADVAYDIFTSADPNHDTSSGDYEVMIWLGNYGGVQPIGSSTGTVNVGGADWDLWIGMNGAMKVFSFVATNAPVTSFSNDVKAFYDHITSAQGFPASSQYLLTLQFGTEPFTGSNAKFTVSHWSASIA